MDRRTERLRFMRSVNRLAAHLHQGDDPWACVAHAGSMELFGLGSKRPFGWYFEGESRVAAPSLAHVCEFLLGCEYMPDAELFREAEYWQHPLTFEQIRKGDCEDHALWAWRKLRELGYPAHMIMGECDVFEPSPSGHAWVTFQSAGGFYLLETAGKQPDTMVQPLEAVRHAYRPYFSVDHAGMTYIYGGWLRFMREHKRKRQARHGGGPVPGPDGQPAAPHHPPHGSHPGYPGTPFG